VIEYIRNLLEHFVAQLEVFMEFKRCNRCGCFFTSSSDVCSCCATKDEQDLFRLNNFIDNSGFNPSVLNLSIGTGISEKNINRFLKNNALNSDV